MNEEQSTLEDIEQKEQESAKIYTFPTVVTGGKGPPPSNNWLMNLNKRCVFLCRPKMLTSFDLREFHVIFKADRSVLLLINISENEQYHWVDADRFVAEMDLFEILNDGLLPIDKDTNE